MEELEVYVMLMTYVVQTQVSDPCDQTTEFER